ncbi:MAG: hypothetical protein SVU32_03580, partial [Candidatus Nanohaloarchaea archaeon]|nr:hypothetical protein [Candidatus Nanohaloarchaea archaeon]
SINCYVDRGGSEGVIEVDIQNSGETKLDLDPVDINVKMPNGDINYTLSHRGVSLSPGSLSNNIAIIRQGGSNSWPNPNSYAVYQFNASARLEANVPYDITITLNDMGHEILTNCQAS